MAPSATIDNANGKNGAHVNGDINGHHSPQLNGPKGNNGVNGMDRHPSSPDYDVVIIGGGFGGCYSLHKFREAGFSCHVFEAGSGLGGVWHWNSYPGARVDSEIPYYQFSIPEVYKDWSWSERFPGHAELKRYFEHVDRKLDLSKDVSYSSIVIGADFDNDTNTWTVETHNGHKVTCQWLIPATGSSHKPYQPTFPNMDSFQGQVIHSASWPTSNVDLEGKTVAIVGAGASGIQCVTEMSKKAKKLTNYIRNPNIALPMQQRPLSELEQRINKANYQNYFRLARQSAAGIAGDPCTALTTDHSPEMREAMWEELYACGGFNFQAANYVDYLVDEKANRMLYDFWCKKTRERVPDAVKADIVAPLEPPYPFATKRSSLENDYYECLSRDNVDIVSLKTTGISEFTTKGIKTDDGDEREFDIIVLATGYDNMTGSLINMGLRGRDGVDLKKKWSQGVSTYLGVMTKSCPNMFMIFGPQGEHWQQITIQNPKY